MIFIPGGIILAIGKGVWSAVKAVGGEIDKSVTDSEAKRQQAESEKRRVAEIVEVRRREMHEYPASFSPVFSECVVHKVLGDHEGLRWSFMRWQGVNGVIARANNKIVFSRPADKIEDAVRIMKAYVLEPHVAEAMREFAESIAGMRTIQELGEICGVTWRWVSKDGGQYVQGRMGDRLVYHARAHGPLEARSSRNRFVPPGYDKGDPRLAAERLRLEEVERLENEPPKNGGLHSHEIDGIHHSNDWLFGDTKRKHLGTINGVSWWFLTIDGVRWVVGFEGTHEVVNRVVDDKPAAIRFRDHYQQNRGEPTKRKALVWGEQDIY